MRGLTLALALTHTHTTCLSLAHTHTLCAGSLYAASLSRRSAAACAGATKRIVVIGGTGHVGSYLCPRLADAGWDVIATSRGEREPYPAAEGAGPAVENPDPRWAKITRLKLDRTADDFRYSGLRHCFWIISPRVSQRHAGLHRRVVSFSWPCSSHC